MLERIIDFLASLRPVNTPSVRSEWTTNGTKYYASGSGGNVNGLDLSLFVNGVKTMGTDGTITMTTGMLIHGENTFSWPSKALTCAGSNNVVTIKYIRGVSAEYLDPVPATVLTTDQSAMYFPLYNITNADGKLEIAEGGIYHLGAVYIHSGEVP